MVNIKFFNNNKLLLNEAVVQRDAAVAAHDRAHVLLQEVIKQRDEAFAQRGTLLEAQKSLIAARDSLVMQVSKLSSQVTLTPPPPNDSSGTSASLRGAYLDLMEKVLIGSIYKDPPFAVHGKHNI